MAWRPSVSLYRLLLRAYPAEFREEYGAEMEDVFAVRARQENRLRLWAEVIADAAATAPREHFAILRADVKHAVRMFARSPWFVGTAVLALALGVGSATAIFSLVNAVLLRDLPYGNPRELVYLWTPLPRYSGVPKELSPDFADVRAWQTMSRSFSGITALLQREQAVNTGGENVQVAVALVLGNFFEVLQSQAQTGRTIVPADDSPSAERVAVISAAFWRGAFHGDPAVLGRNMDLNGRKYRVVGVMPESFAFPHSTDFPYAEAKIRRTDVWVPAAFTSRQLQDRLLSTSAAIGRLRPGVSPRRAQQELMAIESRLDVLNSPEMRGMQAYVTEFVESAAGPVRPLMRLLEGAVLLVLLIACGNVANLLLARGVERVHEMGVRTAMGAPRSRLMRQLLTEALLLAVVGGTAGLVLGVAIVRLLARLNPGDIPRFDEVSVDGRVALFAFAVSVVTGLLFGSLPALASSRVRVNDLLRQGGRGVTGSWAVARRALIVADIALAVALLAGAGLLLRSYGAVQRQENGFAPSTLTMSVARDRRGRTSQQDAEMHRRIAEKIAALPGVAAAGVTTQLPLGSHESVTTFRVDGYDNRPGQTVAIRSVGGDYFRAMDIRLLSGRYLEPADEGTPPHHVVVSESFERRFFKGKSAVGGRFQTSAEEWTTIAGVVADVRQKAERPPDPTVYVAGWNGGVLAIRASAPPERMMAAVRRVVGQVDAAAVLTDVRTMRERMSEAESRRRFQTTLLAGFAGIAVLLALVGVYGLLAYSVRQRTAEIGVRMALGAGRRALLSMVLGEGLLLTGAGLAIGLAVAAGMSRLVESLLYGVRPHDAVTFAAVPVLMAGAALAACIVPAWRAGNIDPMRALRQQ